MSVVSDLRGRAAGMICCVRGCGAPAVMARNASRMRGGFCRRCAEEIGALDDAFGREVERHAPAAVKLRCAGRRAGRVSDVLSLVFIAGVLLYLGVVYGAALVEWIQAGGWQ